MFHIDFGDQVHCHLQLSLLSYLSSYSNMDRLSPGVATAIAIPAAAAVGTCVYLYSLNARVSRFTHVSTGKRLLPSSPPFMSDVPQSLPADVSSAESSYVVAMERVTMDAIPDSCLKYTGDQLLVAYTRAVQIGFASTPQAVLIRRMISEPEVKATFDRDFIAAVDFNEGEVVAGIWRVSTRTDKRVECVAAPPASYKGERVGIVIVAAIQKSVAGTVLVNETWMWRKPNEKQTLIESPLGGWFHALLAKWLVWKGRDAVCMDNA